MIMVSLVGAVKRGKFVFYRMGRKPQYGGFTAKSIAPATLPASMRQGGGFGTYDHQIKPIFLKGVLPQLCSV